MSKIDPAFIEALMDAARLSHREREVMRLDFAESLTAEEVGERLGCSVGCVKTYRSRSKGKIRQAQQRWEAEQRGRDREELDAEDIENLSGFYGFVIKEAMAGPARQPDHGPNIGLTWTNYDPYLGIETTGAEDGRMNAGKAGGVTPDDLTGRSRGVGSAWEERVKPRQGPEFNVHGKPRNPDGT